MATNEEVDFNLLQKTAGPYPLEAFEFVREGLGYTVDQLQDMSNQMPDISGLDEDEDHHVSGQELCLGLRDFAIRQYGLLAPAVLQHWNVRRTADFGRIVFAMIDHGLMRKNERDSIDDFQDVFDFEEEFARDRVLEMLSNN